jgi:hypothetical protein
MVSYFVSSDSYANIWAIECEKGGYLLALVEKRAKLEDDYLKEIRNLEEDCSWVQGVFNYGVFSLQVIKYSVNLEDLLKTNTDENYYSDEVWVLLAVMGITSGYDVNKLKKALEAKRLLQEAKKDYRNTIEALGAELKEDGNYEDYRTWWELPNMPMIQF